MKQYLSIFMAYIKPFLMVLMILFGLYLLVINYKKILTYIEKKQQEKEIEQAVDDAPTKQQIVDPSFQISVSLAKQYADKLFDAMADLGTDHVTILSIANKIKANPKNVVAVYEAFGLRKYFMGAQSALFGEKYDLWYWLKSELNTTADEKKVLQVWQKLLQDANKI